MNKCDLTAKRKMADTCQIKNLFISDVQEWGNGTKWVHGASPLFFFFYILKIDKYLPLLKECYMKKNKKINQTFCKKVNKKITTKKRYNNKVF